MAGIPRRGFFLGSASLAALALGGVHATRASAAERSALPIPPELRPDAGGSIALTAQKGQRSFLPGVTTPTYGINGPFLGPPSGCVAARRSSCGRPMRWTRSPPCIGMA